MQFAWAIILFTGLLIAPETPRYLIKRGQYDKAALSLSKLRKLSIDHPAIFEELDEIKANHEYEMSIGSASYLDCFRGGMLKRQLTGMLLAALQQTTGKLANTFLFVNTISYGQLRENFEDTNANIRHQLHHLLWYDVFQEFRGQKPILDSSNYGHSKLRLDLAWSIRY